MMKRFVSVLLQLGLQTSIFKLCTAKAGGDGNVGNEHKGSVAEMGAGISGLTAVGN